MDLCEQLDNPIFNSVEFDTFRDEAGHSYRKNLKAKLKKENSQLVSATTQLKLTTAGKVIYRCKLHIFRMSSVFCGAHSFILKNQVKVYDNTKNEGEKSRFLRI